MVNDWLVAASSPILKVSLLSPGSRSTANDHRPAESATVWSSNQNGMSRVISARGGARPRTTNDLSVTTVPSRGSTMTSAPAGGLGVGVADGVGRTVGRAVGDGVGRAVGDGVGRMVGVAVGGAVGAGGGVGGAVGVGDGVGGAEGVGVGAGVGGAEGSTDGDATATGPVASAESVGCEAEPPSPPRTPERATTTPTASPAMTNPASQSRPPVGACCRRRAPRSIVPLRGVGDTGRSRYSRRCMERQDTPAVTDGANSTSAKERR